MKATAQIVSDIGKSHLCILKKPLNNTIMPDIARKIIVFILFLIFSYNIRSLYYLINYNTEDHSAGTEVH